MRWLEPESRNDTVDVWFVPLNVRLGDDDVPEVVPI